MSSQCVAKRLTVLAFIVSANAILLPVGERAHDFIEHGDPNLPVKAVFSCHKNFTEYPLSNVGTFQDDEGECSVVNTKILDCVFEMEKKEAWYKADCLKSDYSSLEKMFAKAGYGAIGYPTQFWETNSWLELVRYNYTVAISSEETLQICGENKLVFIKWMNENGYGRFLPKTYNTPDEVQFPCVVKLRPITGTDSNGVKIVTNRNDLDELLDLKNGHASTGEPVLIQEAIQSKAEVVIYFVAYQGRLLNRFCCRVSYKADDMLVLMNPNLRGQRFKAHCKNVPGFNEEIRPFMKSVSEKLQINGMAFLNLKLEGIDSDVLFYGNDDVTGEWLKKQDKKPGESFVKIIEMHARIGGGLQADPKQLGKMIRAYSLAHFSQVYNKTVYERTLYATHYRRFHLEAGTIPEYISIE